MQKELDEAYKIVGSNICQMEQRLGFKALFGAVGGSLSFNLSSSASDIDFYLIVDWKNGKKEMMQNEIMEGKKIDCVCVALDDVLGIWEKYRNDMHKYPTRFYRSEKEMKKIMGQKDTERVDYVREILIKIFLSEKVLEFQPGIIEENRGYIQQCLCLIDVWDYQFNRAYGNFYESIRGKDEVVIRKYLYTIHQMAICYAIMREEEIIMDFEQMLNSDSCLGHEIWLKNRCHELFRKNRFYRGNKVRNCVPADIELNNWIEKGLDRILQEMKQKENFMRNHSLHF